ncbi:MAG TPA: ABC transporter permease [Xanthobacteraceae bacterium]|nr:ABC transporter permease [Xanthobacteraceae bacterium]
MDGESLLKSAVVGERLEVAASGSWTAPQARLLERLVEAIGKQAPSVRSVSIDMHAVHELDTYGAWLLERLVRERNALGQDTRIVGLPEHYRGLIEEIQNANRKAGPAPARKEGVVGILVAIGRTVVDIGQDLVSFVQMFGLLTVALGRVIAKPVTFRLTSAVHHLDRVGWQAVPIILLITFLIGAIISQQGIFHFRKFGADVYVVDMVGILVLREVGVLIVAIMVAGRSGSAYTAELGSMKMREEVDALRTMGFDPVEVLILPRVVALVFALPILTFLGSMSALYGGGLVAWLYGGISPDIFISRLKEAISLTHFEVGIIKAPFMALIIGIVAGSEGMQVKGSAESLGTQTTASVVKSIFLVIVLDGFFAIFFASIGM